MRNIRYLSRYQPYKRSTEYAVFFEHDGIYARLDWELSDSVNLSDKIDDLMIMQIEVDFNDEELINDIKEKQSAAPPTGEAINQRLEDGFVENDAAEFKQKAIERFGFS
jgi:uncharacterized protein (DUF2342 family)